MLNTKMFLFIFLATATFSTQLFSYFYPLSWEDKTWESITSKLVEFVGDYEYHPEFERWGGATTEGAPLVPSAEAEYEKFFEAGAAMFAAHRKFGEVKDRWAHGKGRGCVVGEFKVRDLEKLDPQESEKLAAQGIQLKPQGIFQKNQSYEALIRFSNALRSTHIVKTTPEGQVILDEYGDPIPERRFPDISPDGRGFAIKLIGANPQGNLVQQGTNQDFLFINNDHFLTDNILDFIEHQKSNASSSRDNSLGFFFKKYIEHKIVSGNPIPMPARLNSEEQKAIYGLLAKVAGGVLLQGRERSVQKLLGNELSPIDPEEVLGGMVVQLTVGSQKILSAMGDSVSLDSTEATELAKSLQDFLESKAPIEWVAAITNSNNRALNPLKSSYFSQSPFLFGEKLAAKFEVIPASCDGETPFDQVFYSEEVYDSQGQVDADLGRSNIYRTLSMGQPRCFDFYGVFLPQASHLEHHPSYYVENATLRWNQPDRGLKGYNFPRVKLGQVKIPPIAATSPNGNFESTIGKRHEVCESLSFNAWHAHPEHRPIGSINRARKLGIKASNLIRHPLTWDAQNKEPTGIKILTEAH